MTHWPATDAQLEQEQLRLARAASSVAAWELDRSDDSVLAGGCFLAFARGEAGPGRAGDRGWAAAVLWKLPRPPGGAGGAHRTSEMQLRGSGPRLPRRARDTSGQSLVQGTVPAPYKRGLLALREGPLLELAVVSLARLPDVLLVDATGADHPRKAGLALHLGALLDLPTVGVTHRPLLALGDEPGPERGARSPLSIDGSLVGYWVRTRSGARPVVAHAGWRTTAETAASVVLACSSEAARTPVPLLEARRAAREARAVAEGRAQRY